MKSALQRLQQPDHVTLLTTHPGKFACKRFTKCGTVVEKQDYDSGWEFGVFPPWPVNHISDLSNLLLALESMPGIFIIRGEPVDPSVINTFVHRTGSGEGAQFKGNFKTPEAGRRFILIDIDKYPLPKKLSLKRNVHAVSEYLISQLPPEFHNVSYHHQLSSSAGMGDPHKVSMHLWFYLNRPVPDPQLKAWAKAVNHAKGVKLVDDALFQHVQIHYTARPIFIGMANPFPVRNALIKKGHDELDLDLSALPKAPISKAHAAGARMRAGASTIGPSSGSGSGFEYHLSMVGDHPEGDGFHHPLLRAASSYVGEHGLEGTDKEELYAILRHAALSADASRHAPGEVEQRASREHIMPMIDSALAKYGDERSARQKSRRIQGIPAHYKTIANDASAALAELEAILNEVF